MNKRAGSRDEWYRSAEWAPRARDEFYERLARARPRNRAAYRWIKALSLLSGSEPGNQHAAIGLLTEILAMPDAPQHDRVLALSRLGKLALDRGSAGEAERFLRDAIAGKAAGGGTGLGLEEAWLARILVGRGGRAELEEARELLEQASRTVRILIGPRFEIALIAAKVCAALSDREATRAYARAALDLASPGRPENEYQPAHARVTADAETLRWLETHARA